MSALQKSRVNIIGAGINGLVCAAYLAKQGFEVTVFEKRSKIGGACVTEEVIPGFRFSRASYLGGLLRPKIIQELKLNDHGLEYIYREPCSSFTPSSCEGKSLLLGSNTDRNIQSISQFSPRDGERYAEFEEMLSGVKGLVSPFLDYPLPDLPPKSTKEAKLNLQLLKEVSKAISKDNVSNVYDILLTPASKLLDRWFESDILKTTLCTDAIIGSMISPEQVGSGYILLHHCLAEPQWVLVRGGMGRITEAVSKCEEFNIETSADVREILLDNSGQASGVRLRTGEVVESDYTVVACGLHSLLSFIPDLESKYSTFAKRLKEHDHQCGSFKINLAVDKFPEFSSGEDYKSATVHFESSMSDIVNAYRDAADGKVASKPVVEMIVPSALDGTLVDKPGNHVVQLFVQYAPYELKEGCWSDPHFKEKFVEQNVFSVLNRHIPNFTDSIVGIDALSPFDLENEFSMHKGNIFHGSLALWMMGFNRPARGYSSHRSPIEKLYISG